MHRIGGLAEILALHCCSGKSSVRREVRGADGVGGADGLTPVPWSSPTLYPLPPVPCILWCPPASPPPPVPVLPAACPFLLLIPSLTLSPLPPRPSMPIVRMAAPLQLSPTPPPYLAFSAASYRSPFLPRLLSWGSNSSSGPCPAKEL